MTEHDTKPPTDVEQPPARNQKPGAWQILFSTVAAAFGVQSDRNRQKDFSGSSPWPYIFAGLGFTVVFILVLVGIVNLALSS